MAAFAQGTRLVTARLDGGLHSKGKHTNELTGAEVILQLCLRRLIGFEIKSKSENVFPDRVLVSRPEAANMQVLIPARDHLR